MVTAALLPMHSSRTQAEGTAPIRGSPLSCQRDRERADSCDPPVASAQESRCHSLTGRGLVLTVVKCDMIGVDYSPTGGFRTEGPCRETGVQLGGAVNILDKYCNLSLSLWWSLCKKLENMIILPKSRICAPSNIFIPCGSICIPFCVFHNFSLKCKMRCNFWRDF